MRLFFLVGMLILLTSCSIHHKLENPILLKLENDCVIAEIKFTSFARKKISIYDSDTLFFYGIIKYKFLKSDAQINTDFRFNCDIKPNSVVMESSYDAFCIKYNGWNNSIYPDTIASISKPWHGKELNKEYERIIYVAFEDKNINWENAELVFAKEMWQL
jgi:hypothetical protein